MPTLTVDQRIKDYTKEIKQFKECLDKEAINEIKKCVATFLETFDNLQMDITKMPKDVRDALEIKYYKITYSFLSYFEQNANVDMCVYLMNNIKPFSEFISHISKYCTKIEKKHNIVLKSEEALSKE